MPSGVFLDLASLHPQDLELSILRGLLDDWREYPATAPDEHLAHIGQADVVVLNRAVLDRAVFEAVPHLKLVCVTATGTNNIDLDAAVEHRVVVSNVRAHATDSVTQYVRAVMLAHHTRLFACHAAVRAGDWSHNAQFCLLDHPVRELRGMTLGIIGYGELGRGVARLAEAFGMQILIAQRNADDARPGRVPLDHPLLAPDLPNLILTPHTAWAGRAARQAVLDQTVANIRGWLAGQPCNRVTD